MIKMLKIGGEVLDFSTPVVMGILNVTPDSPYPQRGEIFLVHQLVATRRRNAQHFRYCRRVQEQRQFVIVLVDRFFHSCPPLFVSIFSVCTLSF